MENIVTFKPGDKVRYKNTSVNSEWQGWEGTVQHQSSYVTQAFTTKLTNAAPYGKEVHLTTTNLELVEPAFTYADIQVGDKIRRTLTRPSGSTEVREGVVLTKGESFALDTTKPTGGYILSYSSDGDEAKYQVKLELLERPEPPHWTESKPVGSVGVVLAGSSTKTLTKVEENKWAVYYHISGDFFHRTSEGIRKNNVTPEQESKLTWIQ